MDTLTQKKTDRFRFLNALYERSGGKQLHFENMFELGESIGLDRDTSHNVADYLVGEHLAEHRGIGGVISITHHGIVEVERALSEPENQTPHFPPVINILNIQSMVGSQIQQGTHGSSQTQSTTTNELDAIKHLLDTLRTHLDGLSLPARDKDEVIAEIKTLEAQVGSTKPKSMIIRESLKTLRSIVEGVASTAAAGVILPLFGPLSAFFTG